MGRRAVYRRGVVTEIEIIPGKQRGVLDKLSLAEEFARQTLAFDFCDAYQELNGVEGLRFYGQRGLVMQAGHVISPIVSDGWSPYVPWLRGTGLGSGKVSFAKEGHFKNMAGRGETIVPFRPNFSGRIDPNDKLMFREAVESSDHTSIYNVPFTCAPDRISFDGPFVVKLKDSASGDGVWFADTFDEIVGLVREHNIGSDDFFIEQKLKKTLEGSAQIFARNEQHVSVYRTTLQIISNTGEHIGNDVSGGERLSQDEIKAIESVGLWAASLGLRGCASVDYVRCPDGSMKFLELNARMGAATHPISVLEQVKAHRVRDPYVISITNAKPQKKVESWDEFRDLCTANNVDLYRDDSKVGIIPVSPDLLSIGKASFIAVGHTGPHAKALMKRILQTLEAEVPPYILGR